MSLAPAAVAAKAHSFKATYTGRREGRVLGNRNGHRRNAQVRRRARHALVHRRVRGADGIRDDLLQGPRHVLSGSSMFLAVALSTPTFLLAWALDTAAAIFVF